MNVRVFLRQCLYYVHACTITINESVSVPNFCAFTASCALYHVYFTVACNFVCHVSAHSALGESLIYTRYMVTIGSRLSPIHLGVYVCLTGLEVVGDTRVGAITLCVCVCVCFCDDFQLL